MEWSYPIGSSVERIVAVFTVEPGERSPFGFKYRLFVGEVAYDVENGGAQRRPWPGIGSRLHRESARPEHLLGLRNCHVSFTLGSSGSASISMGCDRVILSFELKRSEDTNDF